MNKFPVEFDSILNCDMDDLFKSHEPQRSEFNSLYCSHNNLARRNLYSFGNLITRQILKEFINILDNQFLSYYKQNGAKQHSQIPTGYSEFYKNDSSPYSCRFKAKNIDYEEDQNFYNLSKSTGLLQFVNSESLRAFVARCSGDRLRYGTGAPYGQVLCYEKDDYIGLHSDWQPSLESPRNFIVCHINLPNSAVKNQLFIYEEHGFLNHAMQNSEPSISIFRPPFWHMTSPLEGTKHNPIARRWLLAITFKIR